LAIKGILVAQASIQRQIWLTLRQWQQRLFHQVSQIPQIDHLDRSQLRLNAATLLQQVNTRRLREPSRWFLLTVGYTLLLAWNERLIISLTVGAVGMIAALQIQNQQWQLPRLNWQRWLKSRHRPLLLALLSGGTGMFATYLIASMWAETHQSWLVTGWLVQSVILGLILLAVLQNLSASQPSHQSSQSSISPSPSQSPIEQALDNLSHPDALQRLIALRQLMRWIDSAALQQVNYSPSVSWLHHIQDCLVIMQRQETDPTVQGAIADALQLLRPAPQLGQGCEPLSMPMQRATPFHPEQIKQDY
jgi:hypothetical protein